MIYIDTKKQGELGTSASDFMQLDDKMLNEPHRVKKDQRQRQQPVNERLPHYVHKNGFCLKKMFVMHVNNWTFLENEYFKNISKQTM